MQCLNGRISAHCDVGRLQALSFAWRAEEEVVCGTTLAFGVLQVKGQYAGQGGAVPTSCQQGGDRLLIQRQGTPSAHQRRPGG